MSATVVTIDHPLVQHKLSLMRRKETATALFRTLVHELSLLLAYEVTRELPLTRERIETPLTAMDAPVLEGKKVVFVSILRAGNGLLNGMLELVPAARAGHIGLYRDHDTLEPIQYYCKLPEGLNERHVIVVDPMLATGHSAAAAIDIIKKQQPKSIKFVCIVTCPEGLKEFHRLHPDVTVYCAAVDSHLNEHGYIVPGLGDAGDRLYGTK